jgi:hypothetical protein
LGSVVEAGAAGVAALVAQWLTAGADGVAFGEEDDVRLRAGAVGSERAIRKPQHGVKIAILGQNLEDFTGLISKQTVVRHYDSRNGFYPPLTLTTLATFSQPSAPCLRLTFLFVQASIGMPPCPIWALKMSSESPRPSHQPPNPTEHSGTALRSLSVAESLRDTGRPGSGRQERVS